MTTLFPLLVALLSAQAVSAGAGSRVAVEQVSSPAPRAAYIAQTPRNRSASQDTPAKAETAAAASATVQSSVPPGAIEACREAELQERAAPEGIDCAAVGASAEANRPVRTAEGSLLELLGIAGSITATPGAEAAQPQTADAIARRLATGDVQPGSDTVAAGVVTRRSTPPR